MEQQETITSLLEADPEYIGRPMLRVEDAPLLQGRGEFVDDVNRPGQVHARVVRSGVAHGRILSIDTEAARRLPGVLAVYTAADLPDVRIPIRLAPTPEAQLVLQPPLARDVVRYVGEPVAVVVAIDPYVAEDAEDQIGLEIEPLTPVVDTLAAAEPGAAVLHDALGSNVVNELPIHHGGDVDALFESADVVVRERLSVGRHGAVPLETRGLVAEYDDGRDALTLWGAAKVKHHNRRILAGMLGLPEERIRFLESDVGGGFGARGEFYPEDFLIPWLAVELRRPVKWIEDRSEHLTATNQSREQICEIEVAASSAGELLAFRARVWVDLGAYARTHGLLMPKNTLAHIAGPYRWQGFDAVALGVLSNKTPVGTYRGPGMFEPAFHRERALDRVAGELGLDPAELRRRNLVPVAEMPYVVDLGGVEADVIYDSGEFPTLWEALLEHVAYDSLRDEVARRRDAGESVGIGVAAFVEAGALGPYEWGRAVPREDGSFVVHVGIASIGQGIVTALTQIAAETLKVPMDKVTISHKDTDEVPEGMGSFASRAVVFGGNAVIGAIQDLLRVGRAAGAEALGIAVDDAEVVAGGLVRERGRPDHAVTMASLGCEGSFRFEKQHRSFSMGAVLAVAVLDRRTGGVVLERCVVVSDVGRAINPLIIRGQIAGGAAQAIGGALLEQFVYDEDGQPQAASFMDYCLPTAVEVPPIEAVVLEMQQFRPESRTPLGAKGAGEVGVIGVGAAVANAVSDALGDPGAVTAIPISPGLVLAGRRQVPT